MRQEIRDQFAEGVKESAFGHDTAQTNERQAHLLRLVMRPFCSPWNMGPVVSK